MKKKIWNIDIRNGIIGGLYFQLLWIGITFICSLIKSVVNKSSFKKSFFDILHSIIDNRMYFIGGILILTVLIGFLYSRWKQRNPLKWNFNGFLGMNGSGSNGLINWRVCLFQAEGKNISINPITSFYGFIQINRTKEKFPLKLNSNGKVVDLDEMISLPKGENLKIVAAFENPVENYSALKGYNPDEFLKKYTPFTLHIIVNGHEKSYEFDKIQSKEFIEAIIENKFASKDKPERRIGPIFKQ